MNVVAGLALLAMLGVLYFLPAIIARSRGHMSAGAIFALNLLLGWTALGWIAAIVWSLNSNTREQFSNVAPTEGLTPVDRHGRFVDAERQRSATVHDGKRQTSASRWILATNCWRLRRGLGRRPPHRGEDGRLSAGCGVSKGYHPGRAPRSCGVRDQRERAGG